MAALWEDVQEDQVQMGLKGQHRESMLCVNQRKGATRMLSYDFYPTYLNCYGLIILAVSCF